MSDHNVNVDAATVANVVSGVINALGLQRGSTNSGASETSTSDTSGRASTRNRPNTRLAIVPFTIKHIVHGSLISMDMTIVDRLLYLTCGIN